MKEPLQLLRATLGEDPINRCFPKARDNLRAQDALVLPPVYQTTETHLPCTGYLVIAVLQTYCCMIFLICTRGTYTSTLHAADPIDPTRLVAQCYI